MIASARRPIAATWMIVAIWSVAAPAAAQRAGWPQPIHDDQIFWKVLVDQLEYANGTDHDPISWDAKAWLGGDFNRIWLKTEGGRATNRKGGEFEIHGVYSRLISPFWEVQAGVRVDRQLDTGDPRTRPQLAFGLMGTAPYWFELEPFVFISNEGDVSFRIEATYELLLTQRLVLEPEIEVNLAAQSVPEWETGSGLVDTSIALRLRYEVRRELAPYVGLEWAQRFGETADFVHEAGDSTVEWAVLGGVRFWF